MQLLIETKTQGHKTGVILENKVTHWHTTVMLITSACIFILHADIRMTDSEIDSLWIETDKPQKWSSELESL